MRLIDADALIDDLKHDVDLDQDSLDYEELTDSNREIIQFDKDCKQNAIDLLQNAPTIEPQRKKGEWIPEFNGKFTGGAYWFSCSKCKRIVPEVRNGGWNFCPNCGADMKKDGD